MPFLVAGIDEVGRGALAGPLMAVASLFRIDDRYRLKASGSYIFLETRHSPVQGVNDSKKLSAKKRREVFGLLLKADQLLDFGIGQVSAEEIDKQGIDWANQQAFERAVLDLCESPEFVLVDGDNPLMNWSMLHQAHEPKGDGLWWPVGAASILAKVIRDSFMAELGADYPYYAWDSNSGYGSDAHRAALIEFGACVHHRKQFIRGIIGAQSVT